MAVAKPGESTVFEIWSGYTARPIPTPLIEAQESNRRLRINLEQMRIRYEEPSIYEICSEEPQYSADMYINRQFYLYCIGKDLIKEILSSKHFDYVHNRILNFRGGMELAEKMAVETVILWRKGQVGKSLTDKRIGNFCKQCDNRLLRG